MAGRPSDDPFFDDPEGVDLGESELDEEDFEDDEEEFEDEDELDWEGDWDEAELGPPELTRTLRFGLFAMAPLFVVYELALAASGEDGTRALSESLLVHPIAPVFGGDETMARRCALGLVMGIGGLFALSRVEAAIRRALRVACEGAVAAIGLVLLLEAVARSGFELLSTVRVAQGASAGAALDSQGSLAHLGLEIGAAAYDELLFRILLLALVFVALRTALRSTGMHERPSAYLAAVGGAGLAALAFAASPLEPIASWAGVVPESFHGGVFTWRVLAGVFFSALLVLRGVGVAAWAHALHHVVWWMRGS